MRGARAQVLGLSSATAIPVHSQGAASEEEQLDLNWCPHGMQVLQAHSLVILSLSFYNFLIKLQVTRS